MGSSEIGQNFQSFIVQTDSFFDMSLLALYVRQIVQGICMWRTKTKGMVVAFFRFPNLQNYFHPHSCDVFPRPSSLSSITDMSVELKNLNTSNLLIAAYRCTKTVLMFQKFSLIRPSYQTENIFRNITRSSNLAITRPLNGQSTTVRRKRATPHHHSMTDCSSWIV